MNELLTKLKSEFASEPDAGPLLPSAEKFTSELKSYRDQILCTNLLQQIEVFALPTLSKAFPEGKVSSEELKKRIAEYWQTCREALDKFFRSVEMVLMDGSTGGNPARLDDDSRAARLGPVPEWLPRARRSVPLAL